MTSFSVAPEVAEIARDLIHVVERHQPLAQVRMEYVWRDRATKHAGRTVLASARRLGGLSAFLANYSAGIPDPNEPFFVIVVARDTWVRLTPEQRVALVDHELCHCAVDVDDDGSLVLRMRGHDLEEFAEIVRRHGLWKSDVTVFAGEIAEQLALAIDDAGAFLTEPPTDESGEPSDG